MIMNDEQRDHTRTRHSHAHRHRFTDKQTYTDTDAKTQTYRNRHRHRQAQTDTSGGYLLHIGDALLEFRLQLVELVVNLEDIRNLELHVHTILPPVNSHLGLKVQG
jgi:hypothetical protein